MKNCWKVIPSNRPTFSQIWQDLHDMLADNEVSSCMHRLFALYYNRNTLKIQNSWPKNKSKILNFRFQILSFTVNLIYWSNKGEFRSRPISAFVYIFALSQSECIKRFITWNLITNVWGLLQSFSASGFFVFLPWNWYNYVVLKRILLNFLVAIFD
jgi:hypothetical protein